MVSNQWIFLCVPKCTNVPNDYWQQHSKHEKEMILCKYVYTCWQQIYVRISRGAEESIIVSCILSMKIVAEDRYLIAKGVPVTHLRLPHSAGPRQCRTLQDFLTSPQNRKQVQFSCGKVGWLVSLLRLLSLTDIIDGNNTFYILTCIVVKHNIYPIPSCLQTHDTGNNLGTHKCPNACLSISFYT